MRTQKRAEALTNFYALFFFNQKVRRFRGACEYFEKVNPLKAGPGSCTSSSLFTSSYRYFFFHLY